jgi:hypothetical protein
VAELGAALVVAPVADPDEVGLRGGGGAGVEEGGVGGFVPDEGAEGEALAEVEVAEDAAKGENAVVVGKVVRAHHVGSGDEAVIGVVEKEVEAVAEAGVADAVDEVGGVLLVNENEVGVFEDRVEVHEVGVVGAGTEVGVDVVEAAQGGEAVLLDEIMKAPVVEGLVDEHVVATATELAGYAAEEVGVAVVPV